MRRLMPFLILLFAGCVVTPERPMDLALNALERENVSAAYRFIEDDLIHPDPERVNQAVELIRKHEGTYSAAVETFSRQALENSGRVYGALKAWEMEERRLSMFRVVARGADYAAAADAIEEILKPAADMERQRLAEARAAVEEEERRRRENPDYGRIIDVQMQNISVAASHEGERIGRAYASATYLDKAFSGPPGQWNYSAKDHLLAKEAGAAAGARLDQEALPRWRARYIIRTLKGDIRMVDRWQRDPFRLPRGLCVQVYRISFETVNEARCREQ